MTELADVLERVVDHVRVSEPVPEELLERAAALVASDDQDRVEELAGTLVADLMDLAAEDSATAARLAAVTVDLGTRWPGRAGDYVRGGAELVLGRLAADLLRWDEAVEHAAGAHAADPKAYAMALGDRARALAALAIEAGDDDEAIDHLRTATDVYGTLELHEDAAESAAHAARLSEEKDHIDDALASWRSAADHLVAAGDPAEAARCAGAGAVAVLRAIHAMGEGRSARVVPLATGGRTLAEAHGIARAAGQLSAVEGIFGADLGRPWSAVAEDFARARVWFRSETEETDEVRELLGAWVDFSEGNAAVLRGLPVDAEPPLRRAHAAYRRQGDDAGVLRCEQVLEGVLAWAEPDRERAARIADSRRGGGGDREAMALLLDALAAVDAGDLGGADALFARAREMGSADGEQFRAALVDVLVAHERLRRGDAAEARRRVEAVDAFLAGNAPTPVAVRRMLGSLRSLLTAGFCIRDGDRPGALAGLEDLEAALLASGAGLLAARSSVVRGELLLAESRPREALDVLLPATLALDAYRFTLTDAERRRRWGVAVAGAFRSAFRAAAAAEATTELAELLETVRDNAVPLPRDEDDDLLAFDTLLAEAGRQAIGDPVPTDPRPEGLGVLPAGHAVASHPGRTVLGVPATIRTPWGTEALSRHLVAARRYHNPVRVDVVAVWTVRAI